jgi:hypothetical protein
MKHWFLALFFLIGGCGASANNFQVMFHPLSVAAGSFDADVAFKVNDSLALTVPLYSQYGFPIGDFRKIPYMRFGTGIGIRIFPVNHAFESGLIIEPRMLFGNTTYFKDDIKANIRFLEGSLSMGYGWVWPGGFSLNLGAIGFYTHHFHPQLDAVSGDVIKAQRDFAFITPSIGIDSGFGGLASFAIGYTW